MSRRVFRIEVDPNAAAGVAISDGGKVVFAVGCTVEEEAEEQRRFDVEAAEQRRRIDIARVRMRRATELAQSAADAATDARLALEGIGRP